MKQNKIKTIEMVRQIRDRQYEQTKDMSTEEKIAFYRERANTLLAQLQTIQTKRHLIIVIRCLFAFLNIGA